MAAAETPHLPDEPEGAPGRRAVLRGISAMGLAAFTVPMALSSNAVATTEAETATLPKPDPKKKGKKKGAAKGKKGAAKGGKLVKDGDTPIASTEDIPVNSGALFEADEYIITQPKAGQFLGYDSLCTHEGCPVDAFDTPGEMNCSCHGAKFDIKSGKVLDGPAKKPLPKKPIIVEGGQIYKAKKA
ncbi:Rieske (2Fe-2S) protein [Sporichthya brevicatena]